MGRRRTRRGRARARWGRAAVRPPVSLQLWQRGPAGPRRAPRPIGHEPRVEALQLRRVPLAVAEHRPQHPRPQARPQRRQAPQVAREQAGLLHEVLLRARRQVPQLHGREQRRSDGLRVDAGAPQRQDGHAHVQRLASRGRARVRSRVQGHVHQAVHLEVAPGLRLQPGQVEALRLHPVGREQPAELVLGLPAVQRLGLQEEPGVGHLAQHPGPEAHGQGADLRQVVEAPERGATIGLLRRPQRDWRRTLRRGVAQEALREVCQLLRGEPRLGWGIRVLVGDPIIHTSEARRVGVAHPRYDDRRRPLGQRAQSIVACMPSQVDNDVNRIRMDHLCNLVVG
mmetsp:Transcript_34277/g.91865  ORF Transcript_34277/g.91865 Transcript_34277/m.91865 type:complete len:340 (-) Transcript_34277:1207-2226(-)